MITKGQYARGTEAFWIGQRVRALVELSNDHSKMPAGTCYLITGKRGGFALQSDKCSGCGFAQRIRKVNFSVLEVIK